MSEEKNIVGLLVKYNMSYRSGTPDVSDDEYDLLVEELRTINPGNSILHQVEEEISNGRAEITHPSPMLSTQKYYLGKGSLKNWIDSVKSAYEELGLEGKIRVTAKLDGLAGYDSGDYLATRGNGIKGYDVSKIFDYGVTAVGGRGNGVGEIVMSKTYFDSTLSGLMSHPRNVVAGIVGTDGALNPLAEKSLKAGAVHFVAYSQLNHKLVDFDELEEKAGELLEYFTENTDYYIDGIVAEADSIEVYEHMGFTGHHRKSQIAIKTIGETSEVEVVGVNWQVGRTRITPVIQIKPTTISGAIVSKISGHHAGNILEQKIGVGAVGKAVRSGEVIPTWLRTLQTSEFVEVPTECPACSTAVEWVGDFIECVNSACGGKAESNLRHFMKNTEILLFGKKTLEILVLNDITKPSDLFQLTEDDYQEMGFGPKQSENFVKSLKNSLAKEMTDVRFVASWGVDNLGKGEAKKLLEQMSLPDLMIATEDQIISIHGFAEKSANDIVMGIANNIAEIQKLISLNFNLSITKTNSDKSKLNLYGKLFVFTGKVNTSRKLLKQMAEENGGIVQSGVNKKTTILVAGENAGSKLKKAQDLGVLIITEEEFLKMV